MCECKTACSCGALITTSKGNTGATGATGATGPAGAAGADGVLDWQQYDLSCWLSQNIIEPEATNDEISQDFIDAFCTVHAKVNTVIKANNDYVFTDKNTSILINPLLNDLFFPIAVVTINDVVNGTASVGLDGHSITFVPNTDFVGTATINYTISDGTDSDTATIYIDVKTAITTEDIETTVETTLVTLLSSNEYWDIGLPIGTKMMISNVNLGDFTFSGITAGKGLAGTKWAKWAICNGNLTNGVDDFRLKNLRGFDYADGSGNDVGNFHGGSDTVALDITNIPPHRHKYFDAFMNAVDGSDVFSAEVDSHASSLGVNQGSIYTSPESIQENTGQDRDAVWYDRNTSNGTDNISDQDELQSVPDPVNVVNAYSTVIVVQKIA